jgi:hypothetical protein
MPEQQPRYSGLAGRVLGANGWPKRVGVQPDHGAAWVRTTPARQISPAGADSWSKCVRAGGRAATTGREPDQSKATALGPQPFRPLRETPSMTKRWAAR